MARMVYPIRIKRDKLDEAESLGHLLESRVLAWFEQTRSDAGLTKIEIFLDREVATAFMLVEGDDPQQAIIDIMSAEDANLWFQNEVERLREGPAHREELPVVMSWTPPQQK